MWVIYLEMAVVLVIAFLIVWWTWPKKKKAKPTLPASRNSEDSGPKTGGD